MTSPPNSLQNNFLIAMPQLHDPNFSGALTYICEHNEHGAMGIIVNKPSAYSVSDVLEQLDVPCLGEDKKVYAGGPVQLERGFILHDGEDHWESSLRMNSRLNLTTSKDILKAIGEGAGPKKYLVALGYAGWGAGQLEEELKENSWLTCTSSMQVLFDTPDSEKFSAAVSILGITPEQLNSQIGHA